MGTGHPSENSGSSAFRFPLVLPLSRRRHLHHKARQGSGPNTRRQIAIGKSIDERSHEAIRAYLKHRGIEVLEEGWAHGSDSINFIAMDNEELVFVDTATKYGGYDMSREEPDQECFKHIAATYLAESEVEGLTSIRYDIMSLLVTGSEKALLRHHKNVLNDGR